MTRRWLGATLALLLATGAALASTLTALTYLWPPEMPAATLASPLSTAGHKAALVFRVGKAGDVRKVSFRLGATTTGQTMKASLQDVHATTGAPTGTILAGGNGYGTVSVADTDDNVWKTVTLASDVTVAINDVLAVVLEFDSTAGNLNIVSNSGLSGLLQYRALYTGAWAFSGAAVPAIALEYSDGVVYPHRGIFPALQSNTNYNSSSTPDERCNTIQFPVQVKVAGAVIGGNIGAQDCDVVFYDTDGTTALRTVSLDKDMDSGSTSAWAKVDFASEVTLAANARYYLCVLPTSASSIGLFEYQASVAGWMSGMPYGGNVHLATRTNAGAWSEDATVQAAVYPLVSAIHDGAGGGGSRGAATGGM